MISLKQYWMGHDDTEGCLVIGDKIGVVKQKDAVLHSKAAYPRFYDRRPRAVTATDW
jgi:hypothetical protein